MSDVVPELFILPDLKSVSNPIMYGDRPHRHLAPLTQADGQRYVRTGPTDIPLTVSID